MPLTKRNVSFQFRGGIDTKTDPKSVSPARLLSCENAVFTAPGRLSKRNGYASLGDAVAGGSTLSSGQALATFGNELIAFDPSSLYSYDGGSAQWIDKGAFVSCRVTQAPVSQTVVDQESQDGATHSDGLQAYAWEESAGVYYAIVDSVSGQVVVSRTLLSATTIKPRVLVLGNLFVFYVYNTSTTVLRVGTLPVATPTASISFTTITTAIADSNSVNNTTPNYDATVIDTPSGAAAGPQVFLAFNNRSAGGGTSLWRFTPLDLVTPEATMALAGDVSEAIGVWGNAYDSSVILAYYNGTAVMFRAQPAALTDSSGAALDPLGFGPIETIANVVSVTGACPSSSSLDVRFYYSISAADSYNYRTRTAGITGFDYTVSALGLFLGIPYSDITSAPEAFFRSVFLAGKAFAQDGQSYVPLAHESTLQPTYFVANGDAEVVAKAFAGVAGGTTARGSLGAVMLPGACAIDATTWRFALRSKTILETESGALYTNPGVSSVTFDFFEPERSYARGEIASNLHLGGGFLWMYDGNEAVEHGFHLYPENVTATSNSTGFTYQYVATYEWTDAKGQRHRSAPSPAITVTNSSAMGSGGDSTVTVPTLRVSSKTPASVLCVVYRTTNNGTIFYRMTPLDEITNQDTSDTVSYLDEVTDATLEGRPLLYTTGGVVENIAPPPCDAITVHGNRLVVLDSTSPLSLWYSKQVTPGSPAQFSDFFTLNVDPRGGAVTALASLDDKLVIFKRSSLFVVTGQGPSATGSNDDFSNAILVTTDCGCVNPRSIVTVPDGLMFQSTKGIYLLDRALRASYIGAEVEAYNDDTVTSGVLIEDANQVRFTLDSGVSLVWDYFAQQWSTFTNVEAVDSVIWDGNHTYLRESGLALTETPGIYTDAGSHIPLRVVTAWLQLASMQGFQRIYKAMLLGEYKSAHSLVVGLSHDFNPSISQQDEVTPTAPANYGDDSPYGSGTPYGGQFPQYQWEIRPVQQKCEAVQFTIEDASPNEENSGEGMNLSGLALVVGVKSGLNRLPAASTMT